MAKNNERAAAAGAVRLKTSELLGYGAGNAAQNMAFLMVSLYLLYFYTDVFKIPAAIAGTIFLITRLVDAVFDPMMGYIADRTNTKWGSFRPYILFGAIPLGILTVLCFTAPDFNDAGKTAYAFTTYLLQSLALSVVLIPYFSLAPVITQDPYERTKVQTINLVLASLAMAVISAGTKPVVALFPNEKDGFRYTVTIFMVLSVIFFIICYASVTEKVKKKESKRYSLKETFKLVGTNTPLLLIAAAYIFYSVAFTVRMSAILYYFKYNLGREGLTALFMLTAIIATIIGTIAALPLTGKLGKRNTYLAGTLLAIAANIVFYFVPYSNLPMIFAVGAVIVFSSNIPLVCHWAMLPDTVDYGEWKTGKRGEGVTYGVTSFVQKLGNAIGGAISGLILAVTGYVPNVVQTPEATTGIMHLLVTLPLICAVLCFALLYFYKLDEKKLRGVIAELSGSQITK
jgi:sugar (glycoside-pentoside-hexuronide) transporter